MKEAENAKAGGKSGVSMMTAWHLARGIVRAVLECSVAHSEAVRSGSAAVALMCAMGHRLVSSVLAPQAQYR